MRNVMPMDDNSTRFLKYSEIIIPSDDLIAEAFGIDSQLYSILPELKSEPSEEVIFSLLGKIHHETRVH